MMKHAVSTTLFAVSLAACSGGSSSPSEPGKVDPAAPVYVDTNAGDKSLIYNLVGRWYPEEEIKKLSDRTLTPEQWCEMEPTTIFVHPDHVEARCAKGIRQSAMIADAKRDKDGTLNIMMRVREDSPMRQLRFQVSGPKATIAGAPCFEGKPVAYARFPEYEILAREILGGRRCAQFIPEPTPSEKAEDGETTP